MPCRSSRTQGEGESPLFSSFLSRADTGLMFPSSATPPSAHRKAVFPASFPVRIESWTWILGRWPVQTWPLKHSIQPFTHSPLPTHETEKKTTSRWWRHAMARNLLSCSDRSHQTLIRHDTGRLCLVKPLRCGIFHQCSTAWSTLTRLPMPNPRVPYPHFPPF